MASLRDIKRRIASVKSTRQITSAMKLVAGAKLRRATEAAEAARPYQQTLTRVLGRVAEGAGDLEEPLFREHEAVRTADFLVFTSDRGLCGGFNNNLLRYGQRRVEDRLQRNQELRIRAFGKKAGEFYGKRGYNVVSSRQGMDSDQFPEIARELAVDLRQAFVEGRTHEVILVFNRFRSTISQVPTTLRLLPISLDVSSDTGRDPAPPESSETALAVREQENLPGAADYTYEPGAEEILSSLLPLYVETVLLQALLETEAGEHAARMTAMDSATRNATELIDSLTLDYNRARQAAITTELIEIVSGAEAL